MSIIYLEKVRKSKASSKANTINVHDQNFNERMKKIKLSLERIDKLMEELKAIGKRD